MAFFDDMQSLMNRGVASASRTAGSAKLKLERADLGKRRRELAAQLGASLYEPTRDNAEFRAGRETLYDGIAALDDRCAAIDAELAALAAQTQSAQTYTCTKCGGQVRAIDAFCAGCGMSVADIMAAYQASTAGEDVGAADSEVTRCSACGARVKADDMFCVGCGAPLQKGGTSPTEE